MKKTIVLMTIVLAIMAAPVFAEVTIGGDIDFGFSSDFASPEDVDAAKDGEVGFKSKVDDLDLDITADVDEFTTVTFSIEWDDSIVKDGLGNSKGSSTPGSFTAKTDITGAFGIDGPADVTLITGYNDYWEDQGYNEVTRTNTEEIHDISIDKNIVIGADVVINDMFTVAVGMNPNLSVDDSSNVADLAVTSDDITVPSGYTVYSDVDTNQYGTPMNMWFQVYGTFDAVSADVYYVMNNVSDDYIVSSTFGADASYAMPMDFADFTFGAAVRYDIIGDMIATNGATEVDVEMDGIFKYAVSAKAVMGALDVGVAVTGATEQAIEVDGTEINDPDSVFGMAIDAGYQVNETVLVYGGVTFDNFNDDEIAFSNADAADENMDAANAGMEIGAQIMAGATTYTVGYQLGSGDIYNRTDEEGMFFRLTAKY